MQLKVRLFPRISLPSRADQAVELELGELIKDPHFTLFESVGALEVSSICSSLYLRKKLKLADHGQ